MESPKFIGFPAGLIGEKPFRLPVWHSFPGGFIIDKPVDVHCDFNPWYTEKKVLSEGLRQQLKAGKLELNGFDAQMFRAVFFLEPEISGGVLLATQEKSCDYFRNALGSDQIKFTFHLLTLSHLDLAETVCIDLPIVQDDALHQSKISHRFGKKASTSFRLLDRSNGYDCWEATTTYLRMHQIRLHAREAGLRLLGENIYDSVPIPGLQQLKRKVLKTHALMPLYNGIALHLVGIELAINDQSLNTYFEIPFSKKWIILSKYLFKK